jgi:hypothetical protein
LRAVHVESSALKIAALVIPVAPVSVPPATNSRPSGKATCPPQKMFMPVGGVANVRETKFAAGQTPHVSVFALQPHMPRVSLLVHQTIRLW